MNTDLHGANKQTLFTAKGRQRYIRDLWRTRYVYLMILPVVAYFVVIKYIPMYWLRIAFYDYKILKGFSGSKYVGLKHFLAFVNGMNFGQIVGNTILLNLESLVFAFPFPIIFALFLNEIQSPKFKRTVQTISYLPHFLSTVIIVAMLNTLLSPQTGSVNSLFQILTSNDSIKISLSFLTYHSIVFCNTAVVRKCLVHFGRH